MEMIPNNEVDGKMQNFIQVICNWVVYCDTMADITSQIAYGGCQ
jgi:hypothetical protein